MPHTHSIISPVLSFMLSPPAINIFLKGGNSQVGFFDDVKKGFESLIKPKKEKKKTSPTMRTASSNVNMERRLQKAGVKPPPKKKSGNWFTKLMEVVDRPADFVRTGLTTYYKTGSRVKSAQAAKSAWKGKTHTSGKQLLEAAAKRGAPLAKWAVQTPRRKAVTGFVAEVLLDPTTYITGGTRRVAFDSGQLVKNIIREVSKETGRKISQQSAKRLAENALRGQVPIGRLGTAVSRALGYQAETKKITTGFGRLTGKPVEAEAKGFAQAAKELEKQARQTKPKKGFALVSEVRGRPGYDKTTIRFMGMDIADITPVVKPIRTALGAVIEASPTLTRVRDALGRVFQFNYTPIGIKGLERELVTGAKQRITQAAREIPYARTKAMRGTLEQWRGVSKQAAEEAPYIIEETKGFASVAGRQAAEKASRLFDLDVERFAKEGIPLNVIDNYVMHLYTDPPEKVKAVIDKWRIMRRNIPEARPSFTRQRTIPTLEEAERLGLHPIKDVRQLTMVHRALTEQAVVLQQMGKDLLKMGKGVVSDTNPGGWVNVTHTAIPALQGKWVHPEVAKALENLYPIIANTDEGIRTLAGFLDRATRAWKSVVLFRPAFHLRNFIGNVFLNIADGMTNPDRYSQAFGVLTGILPEVELAGRRVPSQVVRDWFEKEALKGQGLFREAMHGTTKRVTEEAAKMLQALERGGFGKVAYYVRHPFEASREFGEATDSLGRMANFLHHLDRGLSPAEAAQRTRIALFDYGQLTPAEQQIRRWVMPFYAWTRYALPRMVERLIGAPGLFTGATHLRENMVSLNEVDEQNLPQWLADNQAIPLWVDPQGNVHYVTWNLPLTELMKIHDPRDIRGTVQEVFSMTNPLITVPAQIALNRNILGDIPITEFEDLGGAPMYRDYTRFALSQLGMPAEIVKAQREAQARKEFEQAKAEGDLVEVEPPQKSWAERLLGITTVQSPAAWERQAIYERNRQLQQAIKAAEQQGIKVPSTEEIGEPGELKGFAKVAAQGGYGKGFAGVAARFVAREAGSTPDVIRQAMQMTGVDPSWGPYLTLLMRVESGGNPVAVNPTWVEYSTGRTAPYRVGPGWYQARGLFQMMEPTFRKYAVPGHTDIFNPLDNTLAAIRYIAARYGHPANIPNLGRPGYKGY